MSEHPIATKAEQEALENQRPVPELVPSLTPDGGLQADVDHEVEARRQRRIAFIQNRLAGSSYRMRRDQAQAISR
ncbi:MAG: hypothetical protein QNI84_17115 [Henriciella sp.]|nr:hypothetical protein [Henriciella sp.]